ALVQSGDGAHLPQHFLAHVEAAVEGGGHGQVEQHAGQHPVLVADLDAANPADEVGAVFPLRQVARRFTGGAAGGQGKHRGAPSGGVLECIGVNGDEQVDAVLPGNVGALAQGNVVIPGADQHTAKAGLVVHQ